MKHLYTLLLTGLTIVQAHTYAQEQKKVDFNAGGGFALGGASPSGFPKSIRKVEKYNPGLQLNLQAGATYRLSRKWAAASAIRFEPKGMATEARVKGYYTTFNAGNRSGDQSVTGYYAGWVQTVVKNSYMTLPVHVIRNINPLFFLKAGDFVSLLLEKDFTGFAPDGYIRNQTPVSEKEEINEATYDSDAQTRPINAGIELGGELMIRSRLALSLNVNWALTPLMKSGFQSIDFKLYNLFGNLGVIYHV